MSEEERDYLVFLRFSENHVKVLMGANFRKAEDDFLKILKHFITIIES